MCAYENPGWELISFKHAQIVWILVDIEPESSSDELRTERSS